MCRSKLRHYAHARHCVAPSLFVACGINGVRRWPWLSGLNAIYHDVRYIVLFLVQFWMFASPVAYPSGLVPPRWRVIYGLNPIAGVIEEGFRCALTGQGRPPTCWSWARGE
jgi:lipopolysaccharide transport system permease protein